MAVRSMKGPRLPYVIRKLEGTVPVMKHRFNRQENKVEEYEDREDAGWLFLSSQGHWLRIRTLDDLKRYKIDRRPRPIGEDGLAVDPRFSPAEAFETLEAKVVQFVQSVSGKIEIPGFDGKINLPTVKEDDNYVGA